MLPTYSVNVFDVPRVATVTAPGTGGPVSVLGEYLELGGSAQDKTLGWVTTATGARAGGPHHIGLATETAIIHYANTGPMRFRYVRNATGGAIARGAVVALQAVAGPPVSMLATANVVASVAASIPVGVALFAVAADECFWACCGGVCWVDIAAGAEIVGQLMTTAAGADLDAGDKTNAVGRLCEASAGGVLSRVRLFPGAFA